MKPKPAWLPKKKKTSDRERQGAEREGRARAREDCTRDAAWSRSKWLPWRVRWVSTVGDGGDNSHSRYERRGQFTTMCAAEIVTCHVGEICESRHELSSDESA
eukprot:2819056-Prymnesium_polylepis.1